MIHTQCPNCQKLVQADFRLRGELGRCPFCGKKFIIQAAPWWAGLFAKKEKAVASAAKRSDDRRKVDPRSRLKHIARRPYGRVDVPDEFLESPKGHSKALVISIVVVCVIGVGLLLVWLLAAQPENGSTGTTVSDASRRTQPKPGPGEKPPEEPVEPDEPVEPEEGTEPTESTHIIYAKMPAYAYKIDNHIRSTHYKKKGGFHPGRTDRYCFVLAGHPHVYAIAHQADRRVIGDGFYLWPSEKEPLTRAEEEKEWRVLGKILGGFLRSDEMKPLDRWLRKTLRRAVRSTKEAPQPFMSERLFGDKVVRCENVSPRFLGRGTIIEIAHDYKPSTAIADQPPLKSWQEMRQGVTLTEVSAFAGKGQLEDSRPKAHGSVDTYVWPDGGSVTFDNGRAVKWTAAKPKTDQPGK